MKQFSLTKKLLCIQFVFLVFFSLVLPPSLQAAAPKPLSDEQLLDAIQRKSFNFFWNESNPELGLVRDRAHNFKEGAAFSASSIASVGFALTAYGVGVERNWIDASLAKERTLKTLDFFLNQAPQEHGFFYHFLDMNTGKRASRSELSPIDTALFLAGALFAAEYYKDPEIRDKAMELYERVDWQWMTNGGKTLALAWSPEGKFSKHRWDHYNESLIMYLLAIGSPTHALEAESWKAIKRQAGSYGDYRLIQMPPLFGHQYSHIWIDFKNQNDGMVDYFQNSVDATLAQRAFAIDQSAKYKSYGPDSWGLTACDGPSGYKAYGAPPGWADHDGTIAPTACGSSIVFTPKESLACLRHFYENHYDRLWGIYGFSDAFNLDKDWFGKDVIGIDQGALLLMIENYRSELIWKTMKENVYLAEAMKKVGFQPGTKTLDWPEPPAYDVPHLFGGVVIDGYLRDWSKAQGKVLDQSFSIFGSFKDEKDLHSIWYFVWDENALYFSVKVTDDSLLLRRTGRNLWMDDAIELFIDPKGDGFYWKNPGDFQMGFRIHPEDDNVEMWSWFQDEDPSKTAFVKAKGFAFNDGYLIEGEIPWAYLKITPKAGDVLKLTMAVHDVDQDRSEGKVEWFMRNEKKFQSFELGALHLEGDPARS